MKSNELLPAVFSRHALAYERRLEDIMERGESRGRLRVIELIAAEPGMHVLDLACGPGTLSRRLAPQVSPGGEVVGVDLAPGMIELARAAGTANARFEVMDIEQLSFDDESFDAAACGHGLHFVPHLAVALREARRVLHSGARFAASMPVERAGASAWTLLAPVIDRWLGRAPTDLEPTTTRDTVGDQKKLAQAVLDAGFASAGVEVVEETVRWASAEQLVLLFTSWWECSARLERLDLDGRRRFTDDAIATLRRSHPGAIETIGRNHVLLAVA